MSKKLTKENVKQVLDTDNEEMVDEVVDEVVDEAFKLMNKEEDGRIYYEIVKEIVYIDRHEELGYEKVADIQFGTIINSDSPQIKIYQTDEFKDANIIYFYGDPNHSIFKVCNTIGKAKNMIQIEIDETIEDCINDNYIEEEDEFKIQINKNKINFDKNMLYHNI